MTVPSEPTMPKVGSAISVKRSVNDDLPITGTVIDKSPFGVSVRYLDERGVMVVAAFSPRRANGVSNRYIADDGSAVIER